jgi:hypothetical protein
MRYITSWDGVRKLRDAFGRADRSSSNIYTVSIELAPVGTMERLRQLNAMTGELDDMRNEARRALR